MKALSPRPAVILIVEDEPLIRLAAAAIAWDAGFIALEVSNADEAITILQTRDDIRLVFTDVDMPGSMNGLHLARVIREKWPAIRLLVVSGKVLPGGSELPAGARFFPKPYGDGQIHAAMTDLIGPAVQ
jgi:CheY-like chemotaxis protein